MNSFNALANPRIKDSNFLKNVPPKNKIIFDFVGSPAANQKLETRLNDLSRAGCQRCGSPPAPRLRRAGAAFPDFRGWTSSPP
jgi:hypothetical protein